MDFAQGPCRGEYIYIYIYIYISPRRRPMDFSQGPHCAAHPARREKPPPARRDAHGARTDLRPRPARPAPEPSRFPATAVYPRAHGTMERCGHRNAPACHGFRSRTVTVYGPGR